MLDYDIKKMYEDMEIRLIKSMKRNYKRHLKDEDETGFDFPQWQAMKLKELKRYQRQNKNIVNGETKGFNKAISKFLKREMKQGSYNALKKHKEVMGKDYKANKSLSNSFFKINNKKVNSLIKVVNNDLKTANKAVLRMSNDQYRQVIHKSAMYVANGAMTPKQAIDMANKDFLSRGLNVIEYKDGRRVNIASYSQMAVRTAGQRATLMGEGEFRKKYKQPLVKVTTHGTSCPLCKVWQGKILIDDVYGGGTKKDGNYPLLSEAMAQGFLHPNCRHGLTTYYEGFDDIEEEFNKMTEEEQETQYQEDMNYINRNIKKYNRLEVGSIDEDNIAINKDKKNEWISKKDELLDDDDKYMTLYYGSDVLTNSWDERLMKELGGMGAPEKGIYLIEDMKEAGGIKPFVYEVRVDKTKYRKTTERYWGYKEGTELFAVENFEDVHIKNIYYRDSRISRGSLEYEISEDKKEIKKLTEQYKTDVERRKTIESQIEDLKAHIKKNEETLSKEYIKFSEEELQKAFAIDDKQKYPTLKHLQSTIEKTKITNKMILESSKNYNSRYERNSTDYIDNLQKYVDSVPRWEKELKEAMAQYDFKMNVHDDAMLKILEEGRFKNQFETNTSGGALSRDFRREASAKLFGTDLATTEDREFEKYGYLGLEHSRRNVRQYGNIEIVFKKETMGNRTTFTIGDSLGHDGSGSFVNNPSIASFLDEGKALKRATRASELEELIMEHNGLIKDIKNNELVDVAYIELQYHGDVTLDDIKEIIISKEDYDYYRRDDFYKKKGDNMDLIKKIAEEKGIKVVFK